MDFDLEQNLRFKDSIAKYVKVKTVDSREHEGWLKCIDPMTGNLFLVTFDSNMTQVCGVKLIMDSACKGLEVLQDTNEKVKRLLEEMYRDDVSCSGDVSERKRRLLSWIKKHRLPVVEKPDCIVIADTVSISSPYYMQNCSSMNRIMLEKIRELVAKLPQDIDETPSKSTDK